MLSAKGKFKQAVAAAYNKYLYREGVPISAILVLIEKPSGVPDEIEMKVSVSLDGLHVDYEADDEEP